MKVKVEITEILQKTIEVDASDVNDALLKVEELYYKENIVLDYSDYIDLARLECVRNLFQSLSSLNFCILCFNSSSFSISIQSP